MTTPAEVVARRRAERRGLLELARAFADQLDTSLQVRAVVVVGSVARGDFHEISDIDVVVVADSLPVSFLERPAALGVVPSRVEPVAWTPAEWHRQRARDNPLVVDAVDHGVWLVGSPRGLAGDAG